jgi:protein SCO1
MGLSEQRLTRRAALAAGAAVWCGARPRVARAHDLIGIVSPPRPVPAIGVKTLQGKVSRLDELLRGRVSALQLMFTGCSATCPITGALFADLQGRLVAAPRNLRLLSISIDPLGDDPASLQAWLRRHGAQVERWGGALSAMSDVDRLLDFLGGRRGEIDRHTAQFYVFDAQARLCYRTAALPPPASVAAVMERVAKLAD